MLYFFGGTDRKKSRDAMNAAIAKLAKKAERTVRVSDANSPADLEAALAPGGMFAEKRIIIFEGVLGNVEMAPRLRDSLAALAESEDIYFILEEKADVATKKQIEKHAEKAEYFEAEKKKAADDFFKTAFALLSDDKKTRWVALQRELIAGKAPEAVHGTIFWRAKSIFMKSGGEKEKKRGKMLVERLTELPHEARRRGEEMEYALERFLLSEA